MIYPSRLHPLEKAHGRPTIKARGPSWPGVLATGWRGLFPLLSLLLLLGCVSDSTPARKKPSNLPLPSKFSINELHLLAMPAALNLGQQRGPDAFAVKIYASTLSYPKPVPIREGSLEILLFDGLLKPGETASAKPLKVWTFTVAELKAYAFQTSIGICYQFTPQWGENAPRQDRITIIARYLPPSGAPIDSLSSTIELNTR